MTTLILHGTMTHAHPGNFSWWWNSWQGRGFLAGLAEGMELTGEAHDLWRVAGRSVSEYKTLAPGWSFVRRKAFPHQRGHFHWGGGNSYMERRHGASFLAAYLKEVRRLSPGEPIRIVAHSHGGNVLKLLSAEQGLPRDLYIEQAVLLGTPHFQIDLGQEQHYPHRLDPGRFGRILNLYSSDDSVQTTIAENLPSNFMDLDWRNLAAPDAHRTDPDPQTRHLYENYDVPMQADGVQAHTELHGYSVGRLVGEWMSTGAEFAEVASRYPELLPVPLHDDGA